jgi:hypothetical protein
MGWRVRGYANFNEDGYAKAELGFSSERSSHWWGEECQEQSSIHQPRALGELTGTPPTGHVR